MIYHCILCLHLYVTDISVNWYVHIFSFLCDWLGGKRTIIYRATMKFKMDIWFVRTISEKNNRKNVGKNKQAEKGSFICIRKLFCGFYRLNDFIENVENLLNCPSTSINMQYYIIRNVFQLWNRLRIKKNT